MTLATEILNGDIKAAARLMRGVDDDMPAARIEIQKLYPHTGQAQIIGITGSPGTGKSTVINHLVRHIRQKKNKVAVLVIDPSSPFSGGALLGDRIRMQKHTADPGVFIRSIATRGNLGGLSRSAFGVVTIMDAMGSDVIIIETAHIFALNKADQAETESTFAQLQMMIDMTGYETDSWKACVVKTEAIHDVGIAELLDHIDCHQKHLENMPDENRTSRKMKAVVTAIIRDMINQKVISGLEKPGKWSSILESVVQRELDPYSAAEKILKDCMKFD